MRPIPPMASAAACAALLAALATPALGQRVPSPYEFVETRQEAAIFAGTASFDTGRFGFGPSGGTVLGGRWSIALSGSLGFEAVATVVDGSRDVVDPARSEEARVVGEAGSLVGMLEGRLAFTLTGDRTWHDLAPYLAFGGGAAFGLVGEDPADEVILAQDRFDVGSSFLGTVSAGTRFYLTERFVLRGEGTFSLFSIDTPPGFSDPERGFDAVEEGEWVSGVLLVLSLGYRF